MAPSKQLGFAVVGLGGISERAILPAFRHSKKTKLVALVSGDERKARRLAAKFGAPDYYTYDDYVLCLHHPQVDAVFVATTNGTHAEYTIRAANAGKHVLCEKPMANTVEECREMVDACRTNNVRLMIAYRKYFEPASRALKALVRSGRLGRIRILHSAFTIYLPPGKGSPAWKFDRQQAGGGSLVDVGVYCVNTARWLVDKDPIEASAYAWSLDPARYSEVEENVSFQLKFPEGIVLQASSSYGAAQASFLHIHGEKGWAALNSAYAYDEERRLFGKIGGRWFEKKFKAMDEFVLELDAFAESVRRGRDPEPNGLEGLKDVAIMQAIYRSARENRPSPISFAGIGPA
ncbi:MAG: Gfo/Idh/MocA family oxidoreductase [Acidobacteriia bacterium]|nr:Gfo/Idh/MocA family oxidoreductase [Terriglobia bacterium]